MPLRIAYKWSNSCFIPCSMKRLMARACLRGVYSYFSPLSPSLSPENRCTSPGLLLSSRRLRGSCRGPAASPSQCPAAAAERMCACHPHTGPGPYMAACLQYSLMFAAACGHTITRHSSEALYTHAPTSMHARTFWHTRPAAPLQPCKNALKMRWDCGLTWTERVVQRHANNNKEEA